MRLFSRRYDGSWRAPVAHVTEELGVPVAASAAAGPEGSVTLLSVVDTFIAKELRVRRGDAGDEWREPITVHSTQESVDAPQLVLGHDGARAAVLWRESDRYWAQLLDGDTLLGDAGRASRECTGDASAAIDSAGRLVVAWEPEQGPAKLATFDGTVWSDPQTLGSNAGDVTQPRFAADADGRVLAVWKQHDGAAIRWEDDYGEPTPSDLMSAEIVAGRVENERPLVR